MGTYHKDGYSAYVEGFFVVDGRRFRVAKSDHRRFVLCESCTVPPGTEGDMVVIVDGSASSRRVTIPAGIQEGQTTVDYIVACPF
jgi:hypothetical protein